MALLLALPSLAGQVAHGWPFFAQARQLRASQLESVSAAAFLREHYLAPLVTSNLNFNLPGASTALTISQWSTKDGRFAFAGNPPDSLVNQFCSSVAPDKIGPLGFAPCLAQHGYTQWTSYQPASRFWPFQWIEGGWLLALSVLLIAATIWLVRRRAA